MLGVYFAYSDAKGVVPLLELTATPVEGGAFYNWILDGVNHTGTSSISVTMNQDRSLTAAFMEVRYTLTIEFAAHGNVYLAGDDQEVLNRNQVTKEVGTEQGYMAVADEVSMFHYWLLDDEEQTANPIEITFDADHTLEAVFCARPLYLLPAGGSDWPMLMHDSARTGKTTDIGPSSNELLWRYPAAGHIFGSPVVVDGVVYVGDSEGYVYAINATTNKEIWKYSIGHSITTTPCVANDVVYVCQGLDVYALKAETIDPNGELLWKYSIIDNWGRTVTPVVEDCVVYTAAGATVYALDATTTNKNGELLWQYANNYMGEGASTSAVIVGYEKSS